MKILVVGNGAREHAIASSIVKDNQVELFFAPGNAGTSELGKNLEIGVNDFDKLLSFAKENNIDFTIVGPEEPLCNGIVDLFEDNGLKVFGPRKEAARLEASKAFSKEFCVRHNIPTADYLETVSLDEAIEFAKKLLKKDGKVVLKADGLNAGKGVYIASTNGEIESFCADVLENDRYGESRMVIEEFLDGFEMSLLCFMDNHKIVPMPTAKDHKKIYEGERGLNTGGMGSYSPNIQADVYYDEIEKLVVNPFFEGIKKDGVDFRGIIFIGLMIGSKGINVLEYNVRFGDPETQTILQRIDTNLLDILQAVADDKLSEIEVKYNDKEVITVVLASKGYPEAYEKGIEITGLKDVKDSNVFHAGTTLSDGKVVTNGGRVLSITNVADTFEEAFENVYKDVEKVKFDSKVFRRDIGPKVQRFYVEKKEGFNNEAKNLLNELNEALGLKLNNVRPLVRYDIENITPEEAEIISETILCERPIDILYKDEAVYKLQSELVNPLVVQYRAGQFDQREQGVIDTVAVSIEKDDIAASCAKVYSFEGELSDADLVKIEEYMINPVDQQKGELLGIPSTLIEDSKMNMDNLIYDGFREFDETELVEFMNDLGLAMSLDDLVFVQNHYKSIDRDPNETEIAVLDTYWSDHCRHTTFNTILDIEFGEAKSAIDKLIKEAFDDYLNAREEINRTKPVTLMDLGTIVQRYMRTKGVLSDVEVSDEINACSVKVMVELVDNETNELVEEEYLLMFKNETHNHPTEIEPFGGASTCLGGAIRDPLSGRAYVYQAMRVIGGANPLEDISETIEGKLPQIKIAQGAADGYSSYGNQIGLTTGLVDEIYHEGYKAKRMEVGAVVGAAPLENVKRLQPEAGDVILLIGGRTGRDGVGGATGSSKEHDEKSIIDASAEVQKGNAPTERKIQRLFRNEEVAKMIKKCNDFGAGGVSVAIGELADSLEIHLDRVPLKYKGLTPKEIAISESQERMAAVVAKDDVERFKSFCAEENVEVTEVAKVTDTKRIVMLLDDIVILDLESEFLDSSGADRYQSIKVLNEDKVDFFNMYDGRGVDFLGERLSDINIASKHNLLEKFDATVGKNTILVPMGGKNQITPTQSMVAALPSLKGKANTASSMAYGFSPYLSEQSQFLGGYYAVVESLTKLAASGANALNARLTFQEYFEKMGEDAGLWSKPLKSLLGAYNITKALNIPPIGGKDSMSGTFNELNVPPTLISFAITTVDKKDVTSPELKGGYKLGLIETEIKENQILDVEEFKTSLKLIHKNIQSGNIVSAYAITSKGTLPSLFEMAMGNDIGFNVELSDLYNAKYGSFIVEYKEDVNGITNIGSSGGSELIVNEVKLDVEELLPGYRDTLDKVYPPRIKYEGEVAKNTGKANRNLKSSKPVNEVKVLIPVFPGTNCEWDTADAFEKAGAKTRILVFKNLTVKDIENSVEELAEAIKESQILVFPGGFSLGDEPDGSGKFIANVIRNAKVSEAIDYMRNENDGLILGICNGFQALIKTGLLPFGEISQLDENSATITANNAQRHIATLVNTKAMTNNSPWLSLLNEGDEHIVPISHGEGRVVCNEETYKILSENEQIAFTYVDYPNGAAYAIEGLISPDGKILGKMGHSERVDEGIYKNIPSVEIQPIIQSGVDYFKK
ncbi:MAG: phosphoribosylformylglycinamidine synthase [Tissierellia bacterium]|nr:phosphoribosylformylglycinamidine synthase [Tissierellia bacterium]